MQDFVGQRDELRIDKRNMPCYRRQELIVLLASEPARIAYRLRWDNNQAGIKWDAIS